MRNSTNRHEPAVLIVGAGPTGLALATQLQLFGTPFRIIDRSLDRARESRALAVQARTIEVLDTAGLGEPLVSGGRTSSRLVLHFGAGAVAEVQLGPIGVTLRPHHSHSRNCSRSLLLLGSHEAERWPVGGFSSVIPIASSRHSRA